MTFLSSFKSLTQSQLTSNLSNEVSTAKTGMESYQFWDMGLRQNMHVQRVFPIYGVEITGFDIAIYGERIQSYFSPTFILCGLLVLAACCFPFISCTLCCCGKEFKTQRSKYSTISKCLALALLAVFVVTEVVSIGFGFKGTVVFREGLEVGMASYISTLQILDEATIQFDSKDSDLFSRAQKSLESKIKTAFQTAVNTPIDFSNLHEMEIVNQDIDKMKLVLVEVDEGYSKLMNETAELMSMLDNFDVIKNNVQQTIKKINDPYSDDYGIFQIKTSIQNTGLYLNSSFSEQKEYFAFFYRTLNESFDISGYLDSIKEFKQNISSAVSRVKTTAILSRALQLPQSFFLSANKEKWSRLSKTGKEMRSQTKWLVSLQQKWERLINDYSSFVKYVMIGPFVIISVAMLALFIFFIGLFSSCGDMRISLPILAFTNLVSGSLLFILLAVVLFLNLLASGSCDWKRKENMVSLIDEQSYHNALDIQARCSRKDNFNNSTLDVVQFITGVLDAADYKAGQDAIEFRSQTPSFQNKIPAELSVSFFGDFIGSMEEFSFGYQAIDDKLIQAWIEQPIITELDFFGDSANRTQRALPLVTSDIANLQKHAKLLNDSSALIINQINQMNYSLTRLLDSIKFEFEMNAAKLRNDTRALENSNAYNKMAKEQYTALIRSAKVSILASAQQYQISLDCQSLAMGLYAIETAFCDIFAVGLNALWISNLILALNSILMLPLYINVRKRIYKAKTAKPKGRSSKRVEDIENPGVDEIADRKYDSEEELKDKNPMIKITREIDDDLEAVPTSAKTPNTPLPLYDQQPFVLGDDEVDVPDYSSPLKPILADDAAPQERSPIAGNASSQVTPQNLDYTPDCSSLLKPHSVDYVVGHGLEQKAEEGTDNSLLLVRRDKNDGIGAEGHQNAGVGFALSSHLHSMQREDDSLSEEPEMLEASADRLLDGPENLV